MTDDKPYILVGTKPETIRTLVCEINGNTLPETYVTDGALVHVERVSGSAQATSTDADSALPVAAATLTAPRLAGLLAEHTYTYRNRLVKEKWEEEEYTPPADVLSAVLSRREWRGVRALRGIVGAPVLREDGTLLQAPGYDQKTGLYLAAKVAMPPVPDKPTAEQVAESRGFIMDRFLRDFPWVADADRANALALMFTPVLRRFARGLTPFGLFTATMPGSGKTILTAATGLVYGQSVLPWTDSEEELRKVITSVFAKQVGAVVFDNIVEGTVIRSAILAQLLTAPTWTDRRLGSSATLEYANDRAWMATGNNLSVGGDMPSRTVLVRLDPKTPKPEERTGFAIPDLSLWILDPGNQRMLLWHLLVLVMDWCAAGAPKATGHVMRQFTPWAQTVGGLLAHHGVTGFLDNAEDVHGEDVDDAEWTAFLTKWATMPDLDGWVTTAALRESAMRDLPVDGHRPPDPWDGAFILNEQGRLPDVRNLAARLRGQVGRWHGDYVLRKAKDSHDKGARWHVERKP